MHPACPNKKPNHLQNSFLRKTFSKPASLKRASLVALPAAISHKASLKPKRCASATLIQKTSKNEPKVPFLGPHAQLSKRIEEKHFHGPIFETVRRYQKWDRKIHSKGRPLQQTKNRMHWKIKENRIAFQILSKIRLPLWVHVMVNLYSVCVTGDLSLDK